MPPYSGTIALLIGLLVTALKAFGVTLPDSFGADATNAAVAIITAISMAVGIWRLLHSKNVATTLSAQIVNNGSIPIAGSAANKEPTASDKLNAEQLVRKATQ